MSMYAHEDTCLYSMLDLRTGSGSDTTCMCTCVYMYEYMRRQNNM